MQDTNRTPDSELQAYKTGDFIHLNDYLTFDHSQNQ